MSLYGHNERLYKAVGEKVTAGDAIASAGDSGGSTRPELYFRDPQERQAGGSAALVQGRALAFRPPGAGFRGRCEGVQCSCCTLTIFSDSPTRSKTGRDQSLIVAVASKHCTVGEE